MSIQKKSLINTLKTTKKANVVKEEVSVSGATISPVKMHPRMVASRKSTRIVAAKRSPRTAAAKRAPKRPV